MSDLVNMSEQFKGLPMQELIGAPIKAACDAQVNLAKATADFITQVGIEKQADGSTKPRHVTFEYNRMVENPQYSPADPASKPFVDQHVQINVPLLAIVPIPNLGIDLVDVTFDMEVKSSFQSKDQFAWEAGGKVEAHAGGSWWGASIEIHGSVSSSKENTRSSDNSAKYHVQVHAKDKGTPEGLARVLDMLHQSITPVVKESAAVATK